MSVSPEKTSYMTDFLEFSTQNSANVLKKIKKMTETVKDENDPSEFTEKPVGHGVMINQCKAKVNKSTNEVIEVYTDMGDNSRLILVHQAVLTGPLLRCLQSSGEGDMTPILQGLIRHHDGILPGRVVYGTHPYLATLRRSPWLTEVYYSLSLLEDLTNKSKFRYLARYYVRLPGDEMMTSQDNLSSGSRHTYTVLEEEFDPAFPSFSVTTTPQRVHVLKEAQQQRKVAVDRTKLTAADHWAAPKLTDTCRSYCMMKYCINKLEARELPARGRIYQCHVQEDIPVNTGQMTSLSADRVCPDVDAEAAKVYIKGLLKSSDFRVLDCLISIPGQSGLEVKVAQGHRTAAAAICKQFNVQTTPTVWLELAGHKIWPERHETESQADYEQRLDKQVTKVSISGSAKVSATSPERQPNLRVQCIDTITRSLFTKVRENEMRLFCSFMGTGYTDRRFSDTSPYTPLEDRKPPVTIKSCHDRRLPHYMREVDDKSSGKLKTDDNQASGDKINAEDIDNARVAQIKDNDTDDPKVQLPRKIGKLSKIKRILCPRGRRHKTESTADRLDSGQQVHLDNISVDVDGEVTTAQTTVGHVLADKKRSGSALSRLFCWRSHSEDD